MNATPTVRVGERLRKARLGQRLSLKQIADKASISAATLSRIETSKQAVGLSLFLVLAKILGKNPAELLADADGPEGRNTLIVGFSDLDHAERLRFWIGMADAARGDNRRAKGRSHEIQQLAMQVEELLACIDYVQSELVAIQKKLKT